MYSSFQLAPRSRSVPVPRHIDDSAALPLSLVRQSRRYCDVCEQSEQAKRAGRLYQLTGAAERE
jgi:hypothetical protein